MIGAIPANRINEAWPKVVPMLNKALNEGYGQYDIDDLHSMIESGEAVLIVAVVGDNIAATIVATLVEHPALRELIILTTGGHHLDDWLTEVMESFDKLASEMQADIISVHGRRGWVKKLEPYGYTEAHTTVIKRL